PTLVLVKVFPRPIRQIRRLFQEESDAQPFAALPGGFYAFSENCFQLSVENGIEKFLPELACSPVFGRIGFSHPGTAQLHLEHIIFQLMLLKRRMERVLSSPARSFDNVGAIAIPMFAELDIEIDVIEVATLLHLRLWSVVCSRF